MAFWQVFADVLNFSRHFERGGARYRCDTGVTPVCAYEAQSSARLVIVAREKQQWHSRNQTQYIYIYIEHK